MNIRNSAVIISLLLFPLFTNASYLNEPFFKNQKAVFEQANITNAWELTTGSPDIVVAVLDTGVDIDHPDLANNIWVNVDELSGNAIDNDKNGYVDDVHGYNFIDGTHNVNPVFDIWNKEGINHGTAVAGIIASAMNGNGILGVAPKVSIMPIRVIKSNGTGQMSDITKGVNYAIDNGADIINMSFTGDVYSLELAQAIRRAWESGILVVAASGNDAGTGGGDLDINPLYPICSDSKQNIIFGVGSVNPVNLRSTFSGYGTKCLDISAPGEDYIVPTVNVPTQDGFEHYYSAPYGGTSFATALVSGAAALVRSIRPDLNPNAVMDIIMDSSKSINNINPLHVDQLGAGLIDVSKAVRASLNFEGSGARVSGSRIIVSAINSYNPSTIYQFLDDGTKIGFFNSYAENFKGGVNITTGEIDGKPGNEIISVPDSSGGPHVRIFSNENDVIQQFFALERDYVGGMSVATADIDGDGIDEIVVAAKNSIHAPKVYVYRHTGKVISIFHAFENTSVRGLNLAAGDIDGDGIDEIIVSEDHGPSGEVRIFSSQGKLVSVIKPIDNYNDGFSVAAGDLDGDTVDDVAIGLVNTSHPAKIGVFNAAGRLLLDLLPYDNSFTGGVNIWLGDINFDGRSEIITSPESHGGPHVRVFSGDGNLISQFFAMSRDYVGGLSIALGLQD